MPSRSKTKELHLRHPCNQNLHIHYEDDFEGLSVMGYKGPFVREYLASLKHTIELALAEYPRVLAFRVDLRLPLGVDLPDYAFTNKVISRFFESFTKKIQYHQEKIAQYRYARGCKVRYVWSREVGRGQSQHYHLLILLNHDAYHTLGRLGSARENMINRIQGSWASALGLDRERAKGLVHIPENATYRINRVPREGEDDQLPELFKRASYLCKVATKSYGNRQRAFDTSKG